jgi:hypothetical protein
LNNLFTGLPTVKSGTLFCGGNPYSEFNLYGSPDYSGSNYCDISIATKKGWTVF